MKYAAAVIPSESVILSEALYSGVEGDLHFRR
jgi:hypothetical protein